jgi:hypothetical protein
MSQFLSPPPNNAPIAIYNDGGGLVTAYQAAALRYKMEGRKVEIKGSCRSACLLALSVPKVCVTPGAQVKAHHAYEQISGTVRTDITNQMLADLPTPIRNRLEGKITPNYNQQATLNYKDLRSLGVADCSDNKPVKSIIAKDKPVASKGLTFKILSPIDIINRVFPMFKK